MQTEGPTYTYRATGSVPGYPWGVTRIIEAGSIEEAAGYAAEQLDEPIQVSGPLHTEPKL